MNQHPPSAIRLERLTATAQSARVPRPVACRQSHLLDLVDGPVARRLKQTSHFGVVLDYYVDIVTQACMFLKLVSLPAACAGTGLVAPSSLVAPCAFIVSVKTAALVLAVNSSAAGQYWKQTDAGTPWILRNVVIKEGNYTKWGLVFQMAEQTCWTALWLSYFDPDHASLYGGVICALGPVGLCNIWTNAAVAYEMLRKWEEPAP